jgi:cellulose biosynthesis protein BcsQ
MDATGIEAIAKGLIANAEQWWEKIGHGTWLEVAANYVAAGWQVLWDLVKLVSAFLEPAASVLRPIFDLGGVSVAVLVAAWQFAAKRDLRQKLERIERALGDDETELWLLHKPRPYKVKRSSLLWFHADAEPAHTKYICIYSLKGGVGKTTLAMNLACYLDKKLSKKVLLVDLDFQGSLSSACLAACGISDVPSDVDGLFDDKARPSQVIKHATGLEAKLSNTRIITSFYQFGKLENKLMLRWLIEESSKRDIRHALAKLFFTSEVSENFDVVIFDVPPRLSTGTIAALCSSTHLLLPTILNKMSAQTVQPTLDSLKVLSDHLNPNLELLGVVASLTLQNQLVEAESIAKHNVQASLDGISKGLDTWAKGHEIFRRNIPRRQAVVNAINANEFPYLFDADFRALFNELGDEISQRLWPSEMIITTPAPSTQPSAQPELIAAK